MKRQRIRELERRWAARNMKEAKRKILSGGEFEAGIWSKTDIWEEALLCDKPDLNRVLDLGCGIGRLMKAFAPRCSWIVGFDVCQDMLNLAESYLVSVPNAYVRQCTGKTPEPGAFTFAYSVLCFQHQRCIDDATDLLEVAYESLAAHGKFRIQATHRLDGNEHLRIGKDGFRKWLEGVGFENVESSWGPLNPGWLWASASK